jgi:trigger factor
MQIDVKEIGKCEFKFHYVADPSTIENKRSEVLQLFKDAPARGFRKGVRPSLDAIKMQYREQINDALRRAMQEEAYRDCVFDQKVKPLGTPNFINCALLANSFSCDFSLKVCPKFELGKYKELNIPKQSLKKSAEDMTQETLQALRVQYGERKAYTPEDTIQLNDNVIITYKAFNGEEELPNLSGKEQPFQVGSIGLLGFDEALLGMKLNETRNINIVIPEGGLPSVVGKTVRFEVSLISGDKVSPCPLNDELATKMEKTNFEELRQFVFASCSMQHDEMLRQEYMKQVKAHLLENNNIDLPDWLPLSEAQYLVAAAKLTWEMLPEVDQLRFLEEAKKNVKLSLILDAIRGEELDAQLSDEETLNMVKQMVGGNESSLQQLNESGQLAVLVARLRDEHTLDFVLKNAIIPE